MSARHPSWEEILTAIDSPAEESEVAKHLRDCPDCAALATAAGEMLRNLEAAKLPDPPKELLATTLRRLKLEMTRSSAGPMSAGETLAAALRDLLGGLVDSLRDCGARLVGDSLQPDPALRGPGGGDTRTLLYEGDDYSIALGLKERSDGKLDLRGQVSPLRAPELPPSSRAILAGAGATDLSEISELGEFSHMNMAGKDLELAILLANDLIRIKLPV